MSTVQWRIEYRPSSCIGLSIAGMAPSESAAKLRADLLVRLAKFPITEVKLVPVTYRTRGRRARRLEEWRREIR